eukprot:CAMPEP_0205865692 /NCGR_PEP_ID=MMETSP1083-20121108/8026_1 /ASSEMBLY_ACC=CAM_ASM_000430 /TAXON_ID=97485 /ORGANISM="Prymnesium parvum, Strain Texoma1" /LENGTH=37 /DNA_ID= /DNA_START= /DNA_END= /DNA_ORIENTATION=
MERDATSNVAEEHCSVGIHLVELFSQRRKVQMAVVVG